MTPATKSAPRAKVKKSRSFLSICRRIVVRAVTGGVAAVTVGFAGVGAAIMGVGWLLTVSLEARAELQSVVVDAPRPARLARSGLLADGMPSLAALAVGLSPFPPEASAERPAPASVVALAFAAIDATTIADRSAVIRVATTSIAYVKTAAADMISTGSLGRSAAIDRAQPSLLSPNATALGVAAPGRGPRETARRGSPDGGL